MGNHLPYGITQCYLLPGRGDFPAFTPAEAGTRFSDPEGMQGRVDLGTLGANSLPKTATRQRRNCDSNPCSSEPESGTLTTRPPKTTMLQLTGHTNVGDPTWVKVVRMAECSTSYQNHRLMTDWVMSRYGQSITTYIVNKYLHKQNTG